MAEGDKSAFQKASDTVSGSGGDAGKQGESYLGQAQETLGNVANQAKDTLGLSMFSNTQFSRKKTHKLTICHRQIDHQSDRVLHA